jgi:hypothetical protein
MRVLLVLIFLPVASAAQERFTAIGNSVRDNHTGLLWQGGAPLWGKTWVQALSHCENLSQDGVSDWRLPNYKELLSWTAPNAQCLWNTQMFGTCAIEPYHAFWSSTTYVQDPKKVWALGPTYSEPKWKTSTLYTMCVRGP